LIVSFSGFSGLLLMGSDGRSRKRQAELRYAMAFLCMFTLMLLWSACGGGNSAPNSGSSSSGNGTPVGTYDLTVAGTFTSVATTLTHKTNLTLIVQ
jgi:hypothetical protein